MNTDAIDLLVQRELPAAARGDRDAYGRIVLACQNAVTAIALAITRDVSISEDIAQDAFLSAWQQLRRLKNPASFLPWLRQITRNLARDHHRGLVRRPVDGMAAELAIAQAADPSATPMQRLIDDERDGAAAELISELPEDSREILLLYYREGRSSRQVAALLGMSDAAVRKRLSRARRAVRDGLLQRFADFARDSAPGSAFAVALTSTLGSLAKPAAAAGFTTIVGSSTATLLGKVALGSAGAAAGSGLLGGVLTAWLCGKLLKRYADDAQERRAIVRCYNRYLLTSVGMLVPAALAFVIFESLVPMVVVIVAGMLAVNYQLLVSLPRIMDPLLARDARRRPAGARWRQLGYRLTFGVSGVIISNAALAWALLLLLMEHR